MKKTKARTGMTGYGNNNMNDNKKYEVYDSGLHPIEKLKMKGYTVWAPGVILTNYIPKLKKNNK